MEKKKYKSVYHALNSKAREWWYHKQLRADLQTVEARRKERQSIRSKVKALRDCLETGGFYVIGYGGSSLHIGQHEETYTNGKRYTTSCTVDGWGDIHGVTAFCCLRLGIPIVDLTSIDQFNEGLWDAVIKGPMMVPKSSPKDPPPYTSLSYCPFEYKAKIYKALGANVYNMPV